MRALIVPRTRADLISAGLLAAFAAVLLLFPTWTVDDAYITLRYAHNLVTAGELTWNVGAPPVEGYTGLLWTLLAAGALWAQLPALLVLDLVGLISTLAMVALADSILGELGADVPRRLLARAILVAGGWWAMHAQSGLETMLYTALCLGCVLAYLRAAWWTPLVCLAAALTRPEGVALALALAGAEWGVSRDYARRRVWDWLMLFVAPGVAYFTWRWGYYGQMLPNTFYVKSGSGEHSWLHVANALATAVLLPALAWRESRPQLARLRYQRPLVVALGALVGLLTLFYGQSELLMNYGNRFFMPLIPLVVIVLAASWGEVRVSKYLVGYALLSAVYFVGAATNAYYYEEMERTEHAAAARWIAAHAQADATLMVVVDAGLVPYATGLRTIDVGALNDVYLAHERDPQRRVDYLMAQQPDVVLLATGELGIAAGEATRGALLADPRWQAGYQLAQEFRRGTRFPYHQQVWVRHGGRVR